MRSSTTAFRKRPTLSDRTLTLVRGVSEDGVHTALWEAARVGLILRLDSSYAFLHDRVQEAAYALRSDPDLGSRRIGRWGPHSALGGCPRGPDSPPRQFLCVPPRPRSGSGLRSPIGP